MTIECSNKKDLQTFLAFLGLDLEIEEEELFVVRIPPALHTLLALNYGLTQGKYWLNRALGIPVGELYLSTLTHEKGLDTHHKTPYI